MNERFLNSRHAARFSFFCEAFEPFRDSKENTVKIHETETITDPVQPAQDLNSNAKKLTAGTLEMSMEDRMVLGRFVP